MADKTSGLLAAVLPYAKAVVAVAGALVLGVDAALEDGIVTQSEYFDVAVAFVTAVGVWFTPNKPKAA